MKTSLSATKLRQNLYTILDDVLRTGRPVEIERNGQKLKIVPEKPVNKMDRLEPHTTVIGNPEDIVNIAWENTWDRGDPL
jgi:hypothetical protein